MELQSARTGGDNRTLAHSVNRAELITIGAILAVAAAIRLVGIGNPSLSMDEVSELRIAHAGLGDIVSIGDGFPPLYHLMLHALVPAGDLTARFLSAFFGLATVSVVWLWARRVFGSKPSYWAAGLVSLSPLAVHLSREGRAYGLFLFLAAVSIWALWRALDDSTRSSWILWGAVCSAGMYSHHMFAVVIGAELVVAITERRRLPWREVLTGIATLAALTAPILAIIGHDLAVQATTVNTVHIGAVQMLYAGYALIAGLSLGPSVRELHTLGAVDALQAAWIWVVLLVPTVTVLGLRGYAAVDRTSRRRLVVLILAGLVIGMAAIEVTGVGLRVRYFAWLLVPIAAWMAAGLLALRGIRRWAAAGILAVIALFSIGGHHFNPAHQTEDARSAADYLQTSGALEEPVLVSGWYMARPITYYLDPPLARTLPDDWDPDTGRLGYSSDDTLPVIGIPLLSGDDFDVEQAIELIDEATHPGAPYYLIYSRPFDGDPEGRLLLSLEKRDGLQLEKAFAGIDIYRGVRTP